MGWLEDGQGRMSVVLAGNPKLRNDPRQPIMEEIGNRRDVFSLDGIAGSQRGSKSAGCWKPAPRTRPSPRPS